MKPVGWCQEGGSFPTACARASDAGHREARGKHSNPAKAGEGIRRAISFPVLSKNRKVGARNPNYFEAVLTRLMPLRAYASSGDITAPWRKARYQPAGLGFGRTGFARPFRIREEGISQKAKTPAEYAHTLSLAAHESRISPGSRTHPG